MDFKIEGDYPKIRYMHTLSEKPNPAEFERHCHPYYELLYVKNGNGKYVVESAEYPLQANTLLFLRPYEFHYVCPSKNAHYERYVIHFYGDVLFNGTLSALSFLQPDKLKGKGVYFPFGNEKKTISTLFDSMDTACRIFEGRRHKTAKEETMQLSLLAQLLLLLSLEEPESRAAGDEDLVGRIIEYINLNLSNDLNLEDISQRFFISKFYLCRVFKEHTGVSLITYLNTKRIAMAEQLIKQGEPSTSVAYQVGYKTYSSFYRSYCRYTGHSPAKSREDPK